jgi:tetratricopeptide (TPR) repeat protein
LPRRLDDLLRGNQVETAVKLLQQVPDDEVVGELAMRAGTVWSLAGDDEKALGYFERFLSAAPDEQSRLRCSSEIGLSLRRLGRLEDAAKLYTDLLPRCLSDPDLEQMVRTNYSGVLQAQKRLDEAQRQLELVLRKHKASPVPRALLAQVLAEQGALPQAVEMMEAAIALDLRNGNYHVLRAEMLLELRQFEQALESIDRAYQLGYTSPNWLVIALVVNMALRRDGDVAALLRIVEQVPKEKQRELMKCITDRMRILLLDDGVAKKPAEEPPKDTPSETERSIDAVKPMTPVGKPAPEADPDREAERHRKALHEGRTAHVQIRISTVDSSYAIDFYLRPEAVDYVDRFFSGYSQMKASLEPQGGNERQQRYRFVGCQQCSFTLLSARDAGESFRCQACGERSEVVTVRSESLDELARRCEAAIGRRERKRQEGDVLVVGYWVSGKEQAAAISARMAAEGYRAVPPGGRAHVFLSHQLQERALAIGGLPDLVWSRPMTDADSGAAGETPRGLDLAIRKLRREIGHFTSCSMEVPASEASYLLAGKEQRIEYLRRNVQESPDDAELKVALVLAELDAGNVEEAARLAAALELAAPHTSPALQAAASVALAGGAPHNAVASLEELLEREPRNLSARVTLAAAYGAVGETEKAREQVRAYRALGGVVPRPRRGQATPPDED